MYLYFRAAPSSIGYFAFIYNRGSVFAVCAALLAIGALLIARYIRWFSGIGILLEGE